MKTKYEIVAKLDEIYRARGGMPSLSDIVTDVLGELEYVLGELEYADAQLIERLRADLETERRVVSSTATHNAHLLAETERLSKAHDADGRALSALTRELAEARKDRDAARAGPGHDVRQAARSLHVAERLLVCLWLYPHYRVDSRGPYGCILEALRAAAPDVAKKLADGEAVGAVLHQINPELGSEPEPAGT